MCQKEEYIVGGTVGARLRHRLLCVLCIVVQFPFLSNVCTPTESPLKYVD